MAPGTSDGAMRGCGALRLPYLEPYVLNPKILVAVGHLLKSSCFLECGAKTISRLHLCEGLRPRDDTNPNSQQSLIWRPFSSWCRHGRCSVLLEPGRLGNSQKCNRLPSGGMRELLEQLMTACANFERTHSTHKLSKGNLDHSILECEGHHSFTFCRVSIQTRLQKVRNGLAFCKIGRAQALGVAEV